MKSSRSRCAAGSIPRPASALPETMAWATAACEGSVRS
ncbi:Uncharacterised protein [Bordetella pertussis]|nr:Uncharacterised protein [Bordetella pertussis]